MSDTNAGADAPATPQRQTIPDQPDITINPLVLHRSKLPFTISLAAFVALLILIFTPTLYSLATGKPALMHFDFGKETTPGVLLLALYFPSHHCCSSSTLVSGYYRLHDLIVAVRRKCPENPIPPSAPIQSAGAADPGGPGRKSIDQYVRLSSLERLHRNLHRARAHRTAVDDGGADPVLCGTALLPPTPKARRTSSTSPS